ncbi:ferrous iron transport protein B, partial [Alistipes sp.]|uniref:ferrous iron transport protein B n=1 Tax=Alistipes sp. TaxID=1872444 RepID=UPI000E84A459
MEKEIINKRLSELKTSEEGVITKVFGHGSFRNRITEMGFVRGKTVRVIKNAPLSDPIEYEIMGYRIALRKSEAELIEVSLPSGGTAGSGLPSGGTFRDESVNRFQHVTGRTINVALVGNPNSGKTSLFNVASGSHERVGNYSGVTVDAKQAVFRQDGYTFNLFDLPGTYSITEYTPEELYVRRHILDAMPDVVINVLDASNLERNLFLTTQLIDMDLKVVIALNMYDELEKSGLKLDYRNLGRMIGIPIVPTVASRGEGIRELFKTVIDVFEDNEPIVRHIHINYGKDIEHSIRLLQDEIWKNTDLVARYSSRYLAIKLLCNDKNGYEVVEPAANFAEISAVAEHERQKLERQYKDCVETIITDAKFGFIAGALEETCQGINLRKNRPDDRVDRIMTHKVWGLPIFLLIMWIMFQTTFSLGGVPAGWLETGVEWLGDFIGGIMREGPLRELIVNGIISGVGGVIVFLPNILILFFFISLMEDTGYMARAAFIMDKLMHKIGLHGKSFIPLLMGFGCNVPAIMATRTLSSDRDRKMTILLTPFMS